MSNRLVAANVDDRGAPDFGTPTAPTPEQRLVHSHSFDGPDPIGVCFQQRFAPAANLFVHRMPITTQLCGDLVDRTAPPTHPDGHPPRRSDVNNARWGPIVGSCSMNDLISQSVFGHVQRRFRHRSRTGRPNAGKSTNTTVRSPLDHTGPPHATHNGRALRDPITTPSGAPSPESLIPTRSTSPRPTNFSHMRAGSASTGVLLPRMSFSSTRLWRTPPHFWWIPTPPSRSPSPHSFPKSR